MPYSTNDDLPGNIKELSEKKQTQWRKAFNSALETYDDESKAFAVANAAIKKELDEATWKADIDITKTDDDRQLVFGWLSVAINKDGEYVIDSQGDIIEPAELEQAAYDYLLVARKAGDAHVKTEGVGRCVESMVFTKEKQDSLGIPEGSLPECAWWIGYKIDDAETWAKVKSGEYNSFSIGGRASREEVSV